MMVKQKTILQARGGLKIGDSFLHSAQVTWPLGKIKIYKDKISLFFDVSNFERKYIIRGVYNPDKSKKFKPFNYPAVQKRFDIKMGEIVGYKRSRIPLLSYLIGGGLIIHHKNKKYPPYIRISLFGNNMNKVVKILKINGKKEIKLKKPLTESIINILGGILLFYLLGNLIFDYKIKFYLVVIYLLIVILYYRYRERFIR